MPRVGTVEDCDESDLSFLFANPLRLSGGASELEDFLTYHNKISGEWCMGTSGFYMPGGASELHDFLAYHNEILHEASRRTHGLRMLGGASALPGFLAYNNEILYEASSRTHGLRMPGGASALPDLYTYDKNILSEAYTRPNGLCMPGASSTLCDFYTNGNKMPKEVLRRPHDAMMFERKVPGVLRASPSTSTARPEEVAVGRPLVTRTIAPTKKVMGNAATEVTRRALATQKRGSQKTKKAEKPRQKNLTQSARHASAHVNDDDAGYLESGGGSACSSRRR